MSESDTVKLYVIQPEGAFCAIRSLLNLIHFCALPTDHVNHAQRDERERDANFLQWSRFKSLGE